MPNPIVGLIGASVGGSAISASAQSSAAKKAAAAQTAAVDKSVEEQRRQFDAMQALLKPYVSAGKDALSSQLSLIGLGGQEAQAAAISALEAGPEFTALTQSGEEAILQNAAATGGLRGGNAQAALAKFRPEILSGLINQQYSRLSGISEMGQNAAANVGSTGMTMASNLSNLYNQAGAAQAGSALAQGNAIANLASNVAGSVGYGLGAFATPVGTAGGLPKGATLFGKWGF